MVQFLKFLRHQGTDRGSILDPRLVSIDNIKHVVRNFPDNANSRAKIIVAYGDSFSVEQTVEEVEAMIIRAHISGEPIVAYERGPYATR